MNRLDVSHLHRHPDPSNLWKVVSTKLVVRVTGDVLKVQRLLRRGLSSFRVYKVYSPGSVKDENEQVVDSLGDEAMLLDLGITVLANAMEGLKRNSIYFDGSSHEKNAAEICIFNLETQKLESLHKFDCSSVQLSSVRWFLPSFKRT